MLADLALAEGNKAQAISHVEAAQANGVSHHLVFNQIGRAFLQFGRWHEAADAFRKSLGTEPDNPAALDGLASVHLAKEEWESAIEKSLEAVGLVHFYPEAHFHLAVGLERSGRTREAIAAYETALGLGFQPALLHRHLVELFKPIDAQKADEHKRAFILLCRQPLFRANFKSNLAEGESPSA
jgi:tetratricopeptide (TPR) repeat protein